MTDRGKDKKIIAYGADHDDNHQSGRYLGADDVALKSHDMTVITGKGLNVTGVKAKHLKNTTEMEEPMDTHGDESFSLQTIADVHQAKKLEVQKKQAFGTSQNIFDVSSYGEVHLKDFRSQKNQGSMYKMNSKCIDNSISLVQMGDSMYQENDGVKGLKQNRPAERAMSGGGNANDSQLTGNFEKEQQDNNPLRKSGTHYMNE